MGIPIVNKRTWRALWIIFGGLLFVNLNLFLPFSVPAQTSTLPNRHEILSEADQLYLEGDRTAAEQLYRQVKPPFSQENSSAFPQPLTDPTQLSGTSQTHWQTAQQEIANGSEKKALAALNSLVQTQPSFIPGYILYANTLLEEGEEDEAIQVLEQGLSLFPAASPDLSRTLVNAYEEDGQYLNASITARQFAIVNPDHPDTPEFLELAEKDLDRFRERLNRGNIVQGVLGGVIGILTGDDGARAVENVGLLLQGESGIGRRLAEGYSQQTPLIKDPEVLQYITEMGNDMASLMGRDFDYEFYVVQNNDLNAFALPGGKIFVNTGLILATNSEAELAGVVSHEIAHAVLSHSFQQITRANLLSNLGSIVSFGNLVANLLISEHSRQQERQADIVGTRALATTGYAADGLRNFFITMKQHETANPPEYLSSHPATEDRIDYLEKIIQANGYNRYAFEGVERHTRIQERLKQIL